MFSHISKLQKWTQQGFSHIPFGGKKITRFFLGQSGAGSGANNRIVFDNGITLTGAFTVSFYGYLNDQENITSGRSGICGNKDHYGAGTGGGRISFYSGHTISLNVNSAGYITFTHTGNLEDTPSEIVITRDASNNLTIYQNNISIGTSTLAGTFSDINMVMGNPADSSWFGFSGGMTRFRIYSRALSSEERLINQNGGHVADGCELYYDGTHNGDMVIDKSGNGRHGTVSLHDSATFYQTAKSLTNIVPNGGFNNVTANDFASWTELPSLGTDPNNYVEESLKRLRIVTAAGSTVTTGLTQTTLTVGKKYKAILYIDTITSGGVYLYNNSGNVSPNYTTVGVKVWEFTATATALACYRLSGGDAEDVIVSNILVIEM